MLVQWEPGGHLCSNKIMLSRAECEEYAKIVYFGRLTWQILDQ